MVCAYINRFVWIFFLKLEYIIFFLIYKAEKRAYVIIKIMTTLFQHHFLYSINIINNIACDVII